MVARPCGTGDLRSDLDDPLRLVTRRLALAAMTAGIAQDAGAAARRMADAVVVAAMQVTVDPEVHAGHQRLVVVAKAGRAWLLAVARVGTLQAGREVGDDDGGVGRLRRCTRQGLLEPGPVLEAEAADGVGIEGLAVEPGVHDALEIAGGPHRPLALGRAEDIEVAPACGAEKSDAAPVGARPQACLVVQHLQAQTLAFAAQHGAGLADLAVVVFVIARH